MVFLFRLSAVDTHSLLGWAAISDDRRECVVMTEHGAPVVNDIPPSLWPEIERDLSQSLSTRPLPGASPICRAIAPAVRAESCAMEYVACVPADALPDLSAALYWIDRALP